MSSLANIPIGGAPSVEMITMDQMLQDEPLHSERTILLLFSNQNVGYIVFPDEIRVHCENEKCGSVLRHHKTDSSRLRIGATTYSFVHYICGNCGLFAKVFAVKATAKASSGMTGTCVKIFQEPPYGQPIPKRLFEIIGESNRTYFLQARRAIARGLGVGAYAYYRRIIENTKFDLISAVLKVAQATNAAPQQIELLKKAQSETQFSKAFDMLSDNSAIPAALFIENHNPLTLLHDLLSEGIHAYDDSECLKRAQETEIVLCEIAERMQNVLTDKKTVKAALSSIMSRKTKSTESISASIS